MAEYYYIQSEPGLWTVGTGTRGKGGNWEPESDHNTREQAAARVNFLNGGTVIENDVNNDLLEALEHLLGRFHSYDKGGNSSLIEECRSAIAKAKGEPS